MRSFDDIDAFLRHLSQLPEAVHQAEHTGLDEAGKGLALGARGMIGEEVREWPALAESTVAEKQARGYTGRVSATDPLYRTGELRTSISYTVHENVVTLGSTDPIAFYQEHGTSRIPPRPFISVTMFRDGPAAAHLVAGYVVSAFGSLPVPHRAGNGHLTGD